MPSVPYAKEAPGETGARGFNPQRGCHRGQSDVTVEWPISQPPEAPSPCEEPGLGGRRGALCLVQGEAADGGRSETPALFSANSCVGPVDHEYRCHGPLGSRGQRQPEWDLVVVEGTILTQHSICGAEPL